MNTSARMVATCLQRVTRRFYVVCEHAVAKPQIDRSHVLRMNGAKRARLPPGTGIRVHQLNEADHAAQVAARTSGFFEMVHSGSHAGLNNHAKYCYDTRRIYIAVSRDAQSVSVDLAPARGVLKASPESATVALRDAVKACVETCLKDAFLACQLVLPSTLVSQQRAVMAGPKEGRDDVKPRDKPSDIVDTFTLYTNGRTSARTIATRLQAAFTAVTGRFSPEQLAAARVVAAERRAARKLRLTLKRLRTLCADPNARKKLRVKAGALDGFMAAEAAGLTEQMLVAAGRMRAPPAAPQLPPPAAAAVPVPPAAQPASAELR